MKYHLFLLVWGEAFAVAHTRLALPFLMMPGNLPALASDAEVDFHIYTDAETRPLLEAGGAGLDAHCRRRIHVLEEIAIRGQSPLAHAAGIPLPEYKYALQRECVRHLHQTVKGEGEATAIFLDSNFLLSDGSLAAIHSRRLQGFQAAAVNVLRLSEPKAVPLLLDRLRSGHNIDGRALAAIGFQAPHHFTEAFCIDADRFTPYPSQLIWRLGDGSLLTRAFLPHPLMVPVSPEMARSQSTMDYDMALRSTADENIFVAADSDEMLVAKLSGDEHQSTGEAGPPPTAENIAVFLLSGTNRRHRIFANVPIYIHDGEPHSDLAKAARQSELLVATSYQLIDAIAARGAGLDASTLLYLQSFFGPSEDYISPQLEPGALEALRRLSWG
ncbi:MAG: hypothetical protein VYE18_01905 [Pseudomonadota bacterium]|nr:hypothetical protein [Pseudomonadota bacterium]